MCDLILFTSWKTHVLCAATYPHLWATEHCFSFASSVAQLEQFACLCFDYEPLNTSCYGRRGPLIACPKCCCTSGFWVFQWFKVAYDCSLWWWACCTWLYRPGEFVVARDTLYFARVFTLLLSIQSPFQRASINSSPNRFKMRQWGIQKPFSL